MRTTLNVDDELVARASELTGVEERTALVRMGLQALIAQKSAERLARLGGTEEVLQFVESNRLTGLGLGYVDVHLLVSARLAGLPLWTLDRPFRTAAVRLKLAWQTQ